MKLKILFISILLFATQATMLFSQETVVLSTDRDIYIAGEQVWISSYCHIPNSSAPSPLSKVLYVELLNENNSAVNQLKLHLIEGKASTVFRLPDSISTGNYRLRAYTKWLRNYAPTQYFHKTVAVINPFVRKSLPKYTSLFKKDTLLIHPEGGTLVSDQTNKVLIQLLDKEGKGKKSALVVNDTTGNKVKEIQTNKNGIAVFSFAPSSNVAYSISDGKQTWNLPEASKDISSISLSKTTNQEITFSINGSSPSATGKIILLDVQGKLIDSKDVPLVSNTEVTFKPSETKGGIFYALLYNSNQELIAHRFVSTFNQLTDHITLTSDKNEYSIREQIQAKVAVQRRLRNVTVSVVKKSLSNQPNAYTSLTDLLRNIGDIDDQVEMNDLLISVRHPKSILSNTTKRYPPEIDGEIVSGTILNLDENLPFSDNPFLMNFVSQTPTLDVKKTDSLGRFSFIANRYGEKEIVIQPLRGTDKKTNYSIDLDFEFSKEFIEQPISPLKIDTNLISSINQSIINMQLDILYDPYTSPKYSVAKRKPTPSFYGNADQVLLIDKFINMPTLEEVIRELVHSIFVRKNKEGYYLHVMKVDSPNEKTERVLTLIDGVPIMNIKEMLKMKPDKIDKVEIMKTDYFLTDYNLGRILSIHTKNGDMSAYAFNKNIFRQSRMCYAYPYEYSSPNYAQDNPTTRRVPDFRNTLYWKSNFSIAAGESIPFSFYSSDDTGEYLIRIEGINDHGIIEKHSHTILVTESLNKAK